VGEVIAAVVILLLTVTIREATRPSPRPRLDTVGAVLSAAGLGLTVYGVLQSSTWGWLKPADSPVEPFGLALTPFVVGAGLLVLWAFAAWEHRREERNRTPLVRLALLDIPPLRSGVSLYLLQNLILMGVFFTIPLYLQLVQGLNAFDTGKRMLPISVTMLVVSMSGPMLASRIGPRRVVRAGFVILTLSALLLLGTIDPELDGYGFGFALAVLGVGMGLIASQLGNIIQSAVGARDRSEAGGLQTTAQQLGSSLGTALIGAIVLTLLTATFVGSVANDPRISANVKSSLEARSGVVFVNSGEVEQAAADAGLPQEEVDAIVEAYEDSQLLALKIGLLAAAFIALGALPLTRNLPRGKLAGEVAAREGSPSP
jgi:Na+/melibiose symporter-like transporter